MILSQEKEGGLQEWDMYQGFADKALKHRDELVGLEIECRP